MKHALALVVSAALFLSGCSWLELSPEGKKVHVLRATDVEHCRVLGKTTATVTDEVIGLKRKEHIVQSNLEILARNAAAEMGGDTIVPMGKVHEGKQTFKVYKCTGQ